MTPRSPALARLFALEAELDAIGRDRALLARARRQLPVDRRRELAPFHFALARRAHRLRLATRAACHALRAEQEVPTCEK